MIRQQRAWSSPRALRNVIRSNRPFEVQTGFFGISVKSDTTGRIDLFSFFDNSETFVTSCTHVRVAI